METHQQGQKLPVQGQDRAGVLSGELLETVVVWSGHDLQQDSLCGG